VNKTLTDEQVLDLRIKYEQEGWTIPMIKEFFNLNTRQAYKHVNYEVRCKIIPKMKK
jgi:hypothetical protein